MDSKSTKVQDIEAIARQAQAGEDVSAHFTGKFQAKQMISVSLPLDLLRQIDADCARQGVDRQAWLNQVCAEKLCDAPVNGVATA
jgi:hypothetical protein